MSWEHIGGEPHGLGDPQGTQGGERYPVAY
jgi:hypothetical protein